MHHDEKDFQSRGGLARAASLSARERKAISQRAAWARWQGLVPQATHEGVLEIGETRIKAAVLPDGRRIIHQTGFLAAIGRSRSSSRKVSKASEAIDNMPPFLAADILKPYVSEELIRSATPIFFRSSKGSRAIGYEAELIPGVCEVYLKFRDACVQRNGQIPQRYEHIILACDNLSRGLARLGIIGLVDEATGYQEIRDRHALQAYLDRWLGKELASYAKQFPDDFYEQIYRLREWKWRGTSVNKPQCVARYTKNIVYERLAPGLLQELEKRNPLDSRGYRRAKHYQWLTKDVGHPGLTQHLHAVTGLMRASDSWSQFNGLLDRSFPRLHTTLLMPGI